MKHAYYIASLDQTFGDGDYGQGLKETYLSFCGDHYTVNAKGEKEHQCSRFCGVSKYDTANGVTTILIVRNFFDDNPKAFVTYPVTPQES